MEGVNANTSHVNHMWMTCNDKDAGQSHVAPINLQDRNSSGVDPGTAESAEPDQGTGPYRIWQEAPFRPQRWGVRDRDDGIRVCWTWGDG